MNRVSNLEFSEVKIVEKAKCKYCEFCKDRGRAQSQCGMLGRKEYWCVNPETKKLPISAFGNRASCFIGFGEHRSIDSPLQLKTAPRWCPKNTLSN